MPKHMMIDLETLSLKPNAMVLSIGAVIFDEIHPRLAEFYERIDMERYNEKSNFDIDPGTVAWWLKQGKDAQEELLKRGGTACDVASGFVDFFMQNDELDEKNRSTMRVWGNSASFDLTILNHLLSSNGIAVPWEYYNERCYRTISSLVGREAFPWSEGVKHNALHDAIYQTNRLLMIADKLTLNLG